MRRTEPDANRFKVTLCSFLRRPGFAKQKWARPLRGRATHQFCANSLDNWNVNQLKPLQPGETGGGQTPEQPFRSNSCRQL